MTAAEEKGELEDFFSDNAPLNDDEAFQWLADAVGTGAGTPPTGTAVATIPAQGATADAEPVADRGIEPPEGATRAERLRHYETIVDSERKLFQQAVSAADARFADSVNEPLWRINKETLYLDMVSTTTQLPFTSFKDYLRERWQISKAHGYRILNAYPVIKALSGVPDLSLTTRQVPKLIAVLRTHGQEALLKVWEESKENRTPAGIQATIDRLGLGSTAAEDLDELSGSDREAISVATRWTKAAGALDAEQARQVFKGDPVRARELYLQLKPVVDVLAEIGGATE